MIYTKILLRQGTSAQWLSANTILSMGEIGFETDTKKLKIGDGVTAWSSLNYSTKSISELEAEFEPKNSNIQSHISDHSNPHNITKSQIGLDQVDNTNDLNKPISNATQSALDLKADSSLVSAQLSLKQNSLGYTPEDISNKNIANGYAGLDSGGKVPYTLLPSTVMNLHGSWDASTNTPHLQNGSTSYDSGDVFEVTVAGTINFGAEDITFVVGDWVVYNSSGIWYRSPNSNSVTTVQGRLGDVVITKSDLSLQNVDNTSDLNKPISTAAQSALDLKADSSSVYTKTQSNDLYEPKNADIQLHINSTLNPHNTTKAQIGLSDVPNIDATISANIVQDSTHRFVSDSQITTWNAKQPAGNYITGLTGDVIASGPGSVSSTLSTTGVTAGSYKASSITVDDKGRITSASSSKYTYTLGVAASNSTVTYAAIAGLTSISLPIGTYKITFMGPYQSTNTAAGIGVRLNQVTSVIGSVFVKWFFSQGTSGTALNYQYDQLATTTNTSGTAVNVANTSVLAFGEGIFTVTTAGTVAIEIRSRTAGAAVSLQPGCVLSIEAL